MIDIDDLAKRIDKKIEELESEETTDKEIKSVSEEIDAYLKEKLGEEKYRIYLAAIKNQDEEIIKEIGLERFNDILDEANELLKAKESEGNE